MAAVGEFPGLQNPLRRTVRSMVNPLDKTTVVSIFPRYISEEKPTIQPREFRIEAGSPEKPSFLVVGPSSWWREVDEDQPLLEIPVSSIQIADSIVRDYCIGMLMVSMPDTMPGLFYLPGEVDLKRLKTDYAAVLKRAEIAQVKWFQSLVKLADSLWIRTDGNPLAISDDMRLAATHLGLDKDWMRDYARMEMVKCIACGALRNPEFPVCGSCHAVVDKKRAEELGLVFAK